MRHTLLQRGLLGMLMGGLLVGTAQARTLETAYGDVEVVDHPERVVTLYEGALDAALTKALAGQDRDMLLAALAERGVPAGAVRSVPEVFAQPEAARLVVDDGAGGPVVIHRTVLP